jgi:DNA-directed RNA polymerase subunit RPC12/RpoP
MSDLAGDKEMEMITTAECVKCGEEFPLAEMTERENGWHCPGCNEEVEATNAREAESNKRADRIARRWAWRF